MWKRQVVVNDFSLLTFKRTDPVGFLYIKKEMGRKNVIVVESVLLRRDPFKVYLPGLRSTL